MGYKIQKTIKIVLVAIFKWRGSRYPLIVLREVSIAKKVEDMRFSNLHAFNLAMLDKQTLQILMNPNSMVAKLFKSKYHSRGYLIESNVWRRSSFS